MATKGKAHRFENEPPCQEKFQHGTDDWNLATTGLPLDSPHVNTVPGLVGDPTVMSHERDVMYPSYTDQQSPNIFRSVTSANALANRKNAGHK